MNITRVFPAALLLASSVLHAQENLELGKMWTFENPPLEYLEKAYGFKPSPEWFDALRRASIRFGRGCSSSFVSPQGLIMTNHHCVRDEIAQAQGEKDWVKNGFYAVQRNDEVRLEGLTVQQLVSVRDVTTEINAGVTAADDDASIARKRAENESRVVEQSKASDPADRFHQVVTLFQGAEFQLYTYKIYDDIRLVCAPHLQTAHFGGDFDNFTYPRYCLDFAFCRAYDDGEPADTSDQHFKWCTRGVKKGELVFVTGNPGTTKRLLTMAQLEYYRDAYHPIVNELVDSRLAIRKGVVTRRPELEKELRTDILSWENTQKAFDGYYRGLLDASLMEQKTLAESAFRSKVMADPKLRDRFGGAWTKLADVARARTELEAKIRFQTHGGHPVLAVAMMLHRALDEDEPDEVRQQMRERVRRMAKTARDDIDELTRLEFVDHLKRAERWLPKDDPWRNAVVGDRTPDEIADLLDRSRLRNPHFVKGVLSGKETANGIPALAMADVFVPLMLNNAAERTALQEAETAQGALIGQALFAVYGNKVSPDATLTLRFSDGVVDSYPYNGTLAPYRTTFFGLYGRNAEFDNQHPFDLPKIWSDRRDRIDLSKPVDLVSNNDIIGGNSGSPLVNTNLEVVGLVFDGNIEMLPNRYLYRGDVPRSVSVHVDGILEALRKVYDADRLVTELLDR